MATDQLSKVFSALSDPTRRDILVRLGEGVATVTELAEPLALVPGACRAVDRLPDLLRPRREAQQARPQPGAQARREHNDSS